MNAFSLKNEFYLSRDFKLATFIENYQRVAEITCHVVSLKAE